MNRAENEVLELKWNDTNIPHKLSIQKNGLGTKILLTIVKDIEPQYLSLDLHTDYQTIKDNWLGEATAVSPAYDDGILFSQTRVLFNVEKGCVLWGVTHIQMSDGKKMSADTLSFIPSVNSATNKLMYS
ncbi:MULTISPECIES: hypothetical protein [Vibrio]|uniref:Uncharacterized protein n=1 Tax=Vibrio algicola TaxID=2662262 RepID=A0A5Q0TIZ2_9VIBR|nr:MULTISPECIES: hypothetical protein [Vibrio]MBD1577515.1 hypothetical protein [Vibrio sp. S11_S32]